ncbi:hypothetical protein D915_002757 [Fasciola hepatica]|uniref:Uncharacterized protein n=1 Tax=Fasciola hepatica TaxID=6192 RepID=A0A4E0RIW0_FASHE|nr:hypothetical protein D915_002757 [Fasciola hepatica]
MSFLWKLLLLFAVTSAVFEHVDAQDAVLHPYAKHFKRWTDFRKRAVLTDLDAEEYPHLIPAHRYQYV